MTIILKIPAGYVMENKGKPVDLQPRDRCCRCNAEPASQFESHFVKYEAGINPTRQITNKFHIRVRVHLRLPVCESCYQANFIEDADSCKLDENDLGKIAKWRARAINIISVFTGIAFILLMKIIPLPANVMWLQYLWLILVGAALFFYGILFGLMELKNRKLREQLSQSGFDFSSRRAEVFAVKQLENPNPEDVAVTVALKNEPWAEACAGHFGWEFEKITPEGN